ncbi:MAG: hypothetical protein RLZZ624_239, partial [Cyanobacteriota bacterium]
LGSPSQLQALGQLLGPALVSIEGMPS